MFTPRTTARTVGILLLAAFVLYGVGNSLATTSTGIPSTVGLVMMLLNSAAVIAIGVLMLPILRPHAPAIAIGYLATRIFEGTFLAVGTIALIVGAASTNVVAYNIAMAGLGIGSLFFCFALCRFGIAPRFLAIWGFVGYASFAAGSLLELVGVAGAGLVSAIPGGLFEIAFGIWLIVRGFGATAQVATAGRA
jgi:hypothetical protein